MPAGSRRRRSRRVFVVLAAVTAFCVLGVFGSNSIVSLRAKRYNDRVVRRTGDGLKSLAELNHPVGARYLTQYARNNRHPKAQIRALQLLTKHYPNEPLAQGVVAYERIVGHYFNSKVSWGTGLVKRWSRVDDQNASELRNWLSLYPRHPAADDAWCRVAAAELRRGRPLQAVETLHRALHAPDGDCRERIIVNIKNILDVDVDGDAIAAWLRTDCPPHLRALSTYAAAVHFLREQRYSLATEYFEAFFDVDGAAREELATWLDPPGENEVLEARWCLGVRKSQWRRDMHWNAAAQQLMGCRQLAGYEDRAWRETDPERSAALLHAAARICFHDGRSLFASVFDGREAPEGRWNVAPCPLEEATSALPPHTGYRQAAMHFLEILDRYPGYSETEAVAYSVPLCLWRAGRRGVAMGLGFQAFAERFPHSTLADEALYNAAVMSSYYGDDHDQTLANMRRIVRDHPNGNVVREYGATNRWLRQAIGERLMLTLSEQSEGKSAIDEDGSRLRTLLRRGGRIVGQVAAQRFRLETPELLFAVVEDVLEVRSNEETAHDAASGQSASNVALDRGSLRRWFERMSVNPKSIRP